MSLQEIEESFQYGTGPDAMALTAVVPLYTCHHCGLAFSDEVAEERRHMTVCRALGVLTPSEVREIRAAVGMSQADFAELSGLGKASLGRWERGALVQNEANDNLLRLLRSPENIASLRLIRGAKARSNILPFERKFVSLAGAEDERRIRTKASLFRLYG